MSTSISARPGYIEPINATYGSLGRSGVVLRRLRSRASAVAIESDIGRGPTIREWGKNRLVFEGESIVATTPDSAETIATCICQRQIGKSVNIQIGVV
jgi:hypothetical protein